MARARAAARGANGFQTAECSRVGNLVQALSIAVQLGTHAVELCSDYPRLATPATLAPFPSALKTATYTPPPPDAVTNSGAITGTFAASVLGSVNSNGLPTTVWFEYGKSTTYGLITPTQPVGDWTTPEAVAADLNGLLPGTEYHFRVVATNGSGTAVGTDRIVRTPKPPAALTGSASVAGSGALTVTGRVNPRGSLTTYFFEWGTGATYGSKTAVGTAGHGTAVLNVSALITGLTPGVIYHFQLVASNPSGTTFGGDRQLKAQ
jgi:hypothetical protein